MRLACRLRTLRGESTLRAMAERVGVHPGELSRIERGLMLPRDSQVPALEREYGQPASSWYGIALLPDEGKAGLAHDAYARGGPEEQCGG